MLKYLKMKKNEKAPAEIKKINGDEGKVSSVLQLQFAEGS